MSDPERKQVEDSVKQALLSRFSAYLDTVEDGPESPDEPTETSDLYSVFVEMAGLRSEVRTESRLVKEALDQFRGVFDTLQASHATVQRELDRARAETREQGQAALRPLLLDVIDLRDRLVAALALSATVRPRWHDRLLRRTVSDAAAWQEGLRVTVRRLDQVLLDRRVVPTKLAGRPFDPRLARVVGTSPEGSVADGTVTEEVRAGFLWDDQVLRTAEVIVSKGGTTKETRDDGRDRRH
jgi:molecular chaperone GrpE